MVVCWPHTSRLLCTTAATPAAAGRGKGGPKAHPAGTRSALPATKAAGILVRAGERQRVATVQLPKRLQ